MPTTPITQDMAVNEAIREKLMEALKVRIEAPLSRLESIDGSESHTHPP